MSFTHQALGFKTAHVGLDNYKEEGILPPQIERSDFLPVDQILCTDIPAPKGCGEAVQTADEIFTQCDEVYVVIPTRERTVLPNVGTDSVSHTLEFQERLRRLETKGQDCHNAQLRKKIMDVVNDMTHSYELFTGIKPSSLEEKRPQWSDVLAHFQTGEEMVNDWLQAAEDKETNSEENEQYCLFIIPEEEEVVVEVDDEKLKQQRQLAVSDPSDPGLLSLDTECLEHNAIKDESEQDVMVEVRVSPSFHQTTKKKRKTSTLQSAQPIRGKRRKREGHTGS